MGIYSKFILGLSVITALTGPIWGMEHLIVYHDKEKFCGWPANEGVWSWENEILVGFNMGTYKRVERGHNYNSDYPLETVQARSIDGGRTWSFEKPEAFMKEMQIVKNPSRFGIEKPVSGLSEPVNFTHPDFAFKCRGDRFYYSYNRAKSWEGPFRFPDFGCIEVQARTDYVVLDEKQCLIFLTSDKPDGIEGAIFCVLTEDGGRTFDFLNWIGPMPPIMKGGHYYCVQPATVQIDEKTFVSCVRQRRAKKKWIDTFVSTDRCRTWEYLSTPVPENSWNPPSLIKLASGHLLLTYGFRAKPQGIKAHISGDNGKTWSDEIILRQDGLLWDLGYVRCVQRPDGKVVTIYYYCTEKIPQQHIAATIWDPSKYFK